MYHSKQLTHPIHHFALKFGSYEEKGLCRYLQAEVLVLWEIQSIFAHVLIGEIHQEKNSF